ncbi:MAG TPA: FAD-dependent monooxygenase [Streptosporangiaceae bacterium]|nr:FAD-dependent monooxygenase [Streptosporangiaceae bacterium]
MTGHAVVIAGGGPTGLMLAGELALAGADVAIVERRASQDLAGSRSGGLHSRTIEVLDQRGIADRFLSQGQVAQVASFSGIPLDISDFPTRHNYGLGLWQDRIERTLAGWVGELEVPVYRGREVTGFAQDDTGVDVELSDGRSLRAEYLVGCDGGRSLIRKAAGIEFPGWDPTASSLVAEVEMGEEPEWGIRRDDKGIHALDRLEDGGRVRVVVREQHVGQTGEPTLRDLSEAPAQSLTPPSSRPRRPHSMADQMGPPRTDQHGYHVRRARLQWPVSAGEITTPPTSSGSCYAAMGSSFAAGPRNWRRHVGAGLVTITAGGNDAGRVGAENPVTLGRSYG